jgi:aryl-alcohol dehydrogenase-like predicted oxidoreductase
MESAVSRLGLGVGRLGASAPSRRAGTAEAFAAIALAADAGVRLVECPPEPEGAERILGEVLPREPAFDVVVRAADVDGGPGAVVRRLRTSMRRLKLERAAGVLVRPAAITGEGGDKLWGALLRLKDEGVVGAVGVAACVCDDPAGLARRFRPDLMQLPLSLLDQRLLANGALEEIAGRGVEVHLRSIFLHGLLFFDGVEGASSPLHPHVSRLRRLLAEAGADPMQAALAFALARPEAARVVVGVGTAAELRAVLRAAAARGPALDWDALRIEAGCAVAPARCLAA